MKNSPIGRGVNPSAYVHTLEIDDNLFADPSYVSQVVEKLTDLIKSLGSLRIFNLSFRYTPPVDVAGSAGLDPLESFIRNTAPSRLFVVAGGEGLATAIARSRSCGVRPVCIDSPNVMAVGATDLTPRPSCPQLLPNSNHGVGIDVAAPGSNIISAIAGNRSGALREVLRQHLW